MNDDNQRELVRTRLEKLMRAPVREKRIKAIQVNPLYHGSSKRLIEVGGTYADLEPGEPSRRVLAIFESESFLVCTNERGLESGLPYIFTRSEVVRVDEVSPED